MARDRIQIAAALLFISAFPGCSRKTADPVAIQTMEVKNLKQDGRFYVGGAPTLQGLDDVKSLGVTTIIDLRQPNEDPLNEPVAARTKGFHYIRLPMSGDRLSADQAERFMEAMHQHDGEKVLIHCAGGNRAAAMYGLYLGASGACPTREALERAKKAGLTNQTLSDQVRRELKQRGSGKK